ELSTTISPHAIALVELDGKSRPDIVATGQNPASPSNNIAEVLLNHGDGTFDDGVPYPVGATSLALAVADLSGDGKPDIVVADQNSGTIGVLLGRGGSAFDPRVDYHVGSRPAWVAVADLDGDSKGDIVVANQGSDAMSVLLGAGDGTFGSNREFAV